MEEIRESRSGRTRRNLAGEASFVSFAPTALQDISIEWSDDLVRNVAEAEFALGQLTGSFSALSAEQQAEMVEVAIASEAESSWKLAEGREIGMPAGLVLDSPSITAPAIESPFTFFGGSPFGAPAPLDDIDLREIDDLAAAFRYALKPFDDLPLSRRLLENTHYLMTQSPRYEKRYPGEFRRSPNWISGPDSTLATARFVPPVEEDMIEAFSQLEHFIHKDSDLPVLARIALTHYQFEVVHPFIDGNGRIGRILTVLMLLEARQIPAPILPLSDVLRERAMGYYGAIEAVELDGDFEGWIRFFVNVIREAATRAQAKIESETGEV
ncbi:Fic family protein [Anaerotardibacter muris]|uniref:Fic family protein n=1 Tax=Anaerotardibacter muris TaxID=2941505 RepID=UPI00203F43A0|nr:Fic family protein [Anaerotardibacter muris]